MTVNPGFLAAINQLAELSDIVFRRAMRAFISN
jgi:hypothetical protein